MKPSKRVRSAVNDLNYIKENYLAYYMGDHPHFHELCRTKLKHIEDVLIELAIDRKLNNIQLVKKLEGKNG